MRKSSLYSNNL